MKEIERESHNPTPDKDCLTSDKDDVDVVIVSDSESESEDISVIDPVNDSGSVGNCSTNSPSSENSADSELPKRSKRKAETMVNSQEVAQFEDSDLHEITSTTDEDRVRYLIYISINSNISKSSEVFWKCKKKNRIL